jgi:CheY-like chemotaxis protein
MTISARPDTVAAGDPLIAPGDYIRLEVNDTGEGMDEETLSRALEPFYTTKGVGKGTGLGLSMVHGLAAQSGGRLTLRSRWGQGTTVEMWLPVATGPIQSAAVVALEDAEAVTRPLRILAVDDDGLVLMNTAALLEDLGHEVVQAASAKEALEALENSAPFDMVITDQAMPRMTGLQLRDQILRVRADLPVLIATGYAEMPPGTDAALPRISKPFTQRDLMAAIDGAMQLRRAAPVA